MAGKYFPPGTVATANPETGGPKWRRFPTLEVLRRLPGAMEWSFFCISTHTGVAAGAPLTNVSLGVPSNYRVKGGFEGVITWVQLGPNLFPTSAGNTWLAGLAQNGDPIPGWSPIGQLMATDGMGNWWTECLIPIAENATIQIVKLGDTLGAGNPADIGGAVHGLVWPVRSRLQWQETTGKILVGGD